MELREIHREITAPALACVLLEAQVLVEADRIVPIPTGLDDQSAQTALAGVVEELLAESTPNAAATTINWRFTTANARIKLKRLYPSLETQDPSLQQDNVAEEV